MLKWLSVPFSIVDIPTQPCGRTYPLWTYPPLGHTHPPASNTWWSSLETYPPPEQNRTTDTCENISFPQLLWRAVNIEGLKSPQMCVWEVRIPRADGKLPCQAVHVFAPVGSVYIRNLPTALSLIHSRLHVRGGGTISNTGALSWIMVMKWEANSLRILCW